MKFRPRFTVRTLAIFVTLVCAYFGAWEATTKWGKTNALTKHSTYGTAHEAWSPLPFVLICDDDGIFNPRRGYYLWLFGPTFRLPFESPFAGLPISMDET